MQLEDWFNMFTKMIMAVWILCKKKRTLLNFLRNATLCVARFFLTSVPQCIIYSTWKIQVEQCIAIVRIPLFDSHLLIPKLKHGPYELATSINTCACAPQWRSFYEPEKDEKLCAGFTMSWKQWPSHRLDILAVCQERIFRFFKLLIMDMFITCLKYKWGS